MLYLRRLNLQLVKRRKNLGLLIAVAMSIFGIGMAGGAVRTFADKIDICLILLTD